jgi:hypothetical protein
MAIKAFIIISSTNRHSILECSQITYKAYEIII